MILLLSNVTVADIVKDFTALLIVADLDDYYYLTVRRSTPFGRLVSEGSVMLADSKLKFEGLTKIETTSSRGAPNSRKLEEI